MHRVCPRWEKNSHIRTRIHMNGQRKCTVNEQTLSKRWFAQQKEVCAGLAIQCLRLDNLGWTTWTNKDLKLSRCSDLTAVNFGCHNIWIVHSFKGLWTRVPTLVNLTHYQTFKRMHHQISPVQGVISAKTTVIMVIEHHNGPPSVWHCRWLARFYGGDFAIFNLIMISNADSAEISPPQGAP